MTIGIEGAPRCTRVTGTKASAAACGTAAAVREVKIRGRVRTAPSADVRAALGSRKGGDGEFGRERRAMEQITRNYTGGVRTVRCRAW